MARRTLLLSVYGLGQLRLYPADGTPHLPGTAGCLYGRDHKHGKERGSAGRSPVGARESSCTQRAGCLSTRGLSSARVFSTGPRPVREPSRHVAVSERQGVRSLSVSRDLQPHPWIYLQAADGAGGPDLSLRAPSLLTVTGSGFP